MVPRLADGRQRRSRWHIRVWSDRAHNEAVARAYAYRDGMHPRWRNPGDADEPWWRASAEHQTGEPGAGLTSPPHSASMARTPFQQSEGSGEPNAVFWLMSGLYVDCGLYSAQPNDLEVALGDLDLMGSKCHRQCSELGPAFASVEFEDGRGSGNVRPCASPLFLRRKRGLIHGRVRPLTCAIADVAGRVFAAGSRHVRLRLCRRCPLPPSDRPSLPPPCWHTPFFFHFRGSASSAGRVSAVRPPAFCRQKPSARRLGRKDFRRLCRFFVPG